MASASTAAGAATAATTATGATTSTSGTRTGTGAITTAGCTAGAEIAVGITHLGVERILERGNFNTVGGRSSGLGPGSSRGRGSRRSWAVAV